MKNFHVPLPEGTYDRLRAEAQKRGQPATALAREALEDWLKEQRRREIDDDLRAFVETYAGTEIDYDPAVEESGLRTIAESEWQWKG